MNGPFDRKRLTELFTGRWYPYLWITLVCYLLFAKTLAFQLTGADDTKLILSNRELFSDPGNLLSLFRGTVFPGSSIPFYRPLLSLSFMLDTLWAGTTLIPYHLTNIGLHAVSSCLVFALLLRFDYSRRRSLLLALLFAVHPALSSTVAWIPGRNDSLLAVFVLGAVLTLTGFVRTGSLRHRAAHLLCIVAALFTKETATALVPLFVLYLLIFARERAARVMRTLAPGWLGTALLWFGAKSLAGGQQGTDWQAVVKTLRETGITAPVYYIGKAVLPLNLSVYPLHADTTCIYGILGILFLAVVLARAPAGNRPRVIFGVVWCLLTLLPVLLLPVNISPEHRLYIPMIGLLIVLAETEHALPFLKRPGLLPSLGAGVLLLFAGQTFFHIDHYMGRLSFWRNAAATSPRDYLAHCNLGDAWFRNGHLDKAEEEFRRARELNPQDLSSSINLVAILIERGKHGEAEQELRNLLAERGPVDSVLYKYAGLCYELGRQDEAAWLWERVIEANPGFLYAYRNLAVLSLKRGDREKYERYARLLGERPNGETLLASLEQPGASWYYEVPSWW